MDNAETIMQYYCPYLSAIQIYTCRLERRYTEKVGNKPWCDDRENNRMLMALCEKSKRSSGTTSSNFTLNLDGKLQGRDQLGYLYCQYNETSIPYDRLPLTAKISELAQIHPGLMKFKSTDLSPYSWMSVAWYPIYQIPSVKNVKELSASFLSYHSLSSSFQGFTKPTPAEEEKIINLSHTSEVNRHMKLKEDRRGKKSLSPLAVATYKMFGELWTTPTPRYQERIITYQSSIHSWLRQLKFHHHDLNFFMARSFDYRNA